MRHALSKFNKNDKNGFEDTLLIGMLKLLTVNRLEILICKVKNLVKKTQDLLD